MFAQQSYNNLRPEQRLGLAGRRKVSWSLPGRGNKIKPVTDKKISVSVQEEEEVVTAPPEQKCKENFSPW